MRGKIERNPVISAVRSGSLRSFEELARALGVKWSAVWEAEVREAVPGVGDMLFANECAVRASAARKAGHDDVMKTHRFAMFRAMLAYMDAGVPCAVPQGLPAEVAEAIGVGAQGGAEGGAGGAQGAKEGAKEGKAGNADNVGSAGGVGVRVARGGSKQAIPKLTPVPAGEVKGKVLPALVMGAEEGEYRGRKVIWLRRMPGIFGTRAGGRTSPQRCTLRNGMVNQCDLKDPVTPYWAAFDAACGFKREFTREQVVKEAMRVGGFDAKAVGIAWDVLKNHQHHPRKRDCGMGYVVDSLAGGRMTIRPRDEAETQQYFDAQKARGKGGGSKPAKGAREPTEQRPVAVVVDRSRDSKVEERV